MQRPCNEHDYPQGQPYQTGQCFVCWSYANHPLYRAIWGGEPIRRKPLPCVYLGEATGEQRECDSCPGSTKIKTFACEIHGTCTPVKKLPGVACCEDNCTSYQVKLPPTLFAPKPSDPACGVVLGTYTRWPALVELQIRLARSHCGFDIPILIADDCSPSAKELQVLASRYQGVTYWPNVQRIGHAGGDLSAIWKGIIWGHSKGLSVLAKLSQRFLPHTTRWLQDGATELLASGKPLATQRCRGRETFPLRSEAMLLDVKAWHKPSLLGDLSPVQQHANGEHTLHQIVCNHFGDVMHPWSFLGSEERYARNSGYLWHCANNPEDYHALAAKHGLKLPDDIHCNGWQVTESPQGTYSIG